MAARARVAIVGAGNLGSALAVALRRAGHAIDEIIVKPGTTAARGTASLAREVGAQLADIPHASLKADVVWFCVPDGEIEKVASELRSRDWNGKVALHSSGALTSDELATLRQRGASVASVHPLMTFVRKSRPAIEGVSFAIEGDAAAVSVARRVVKNLGGMAYTIRKRDKAAYHAWGTFASPLLTALLVTTEKVAAAAGVKCNEAKKRMLPILRQTLENYAAIDAAHAFSGPIIRGDIDTMQKHLRTLRQMPEERDVYLALARAAVKYLPAKNRQELKKILKGK